MSSINPLDLAQLSTQLGQLRTNLPPVGGAVLNPSTPGLLGPSGAPISGTPSFITPPPNLTAPAPAGPPMSAARMMVGYDQLRSALPGAPARAMKATPNALGAMEARSRLASQAQAGAAQAADAGAGKTPGLGSRIVDRIAQINKADPALRAAADGADDAAGAVGKLGKLKAASGWLKGIGGPGLLKGAGIGLAGSLASAGIDSLDLGGEDSVIDDTLTGATKWGSTGMMFGPLGGIILGGVGAVGENVGTVWNHNQEMGGIKEYNEKLSRAGDSLRVAGVPEDIRKDLGQKADLALEQIRLREGREPTLDERNEIVNSFFEIANAYQADPLGTRVELGYFKGPSEEQKALALQAQLANLMAPYAQASQQTGELAYQAMMNAASYEQNAPLRAAYQQQAAALRHGSSDQARAFMGQVQVTPYVMQLEANAALRNQLAQQQAAGGGGGDDLETLLADLSAPEG